jgi:hypothetical protein
MLRINYPAGADPVLELEAVREVITRQTLDNLKLYRRDDGVVVKGDGAKLMRLKLALPGHFTSDLILPHP